VPFLGKILVGKLHSSTKKGTFGRKKDTFGRKGVRIRLCPRILKNKTFILQERCALLKKWYQLMMDEQENLAKLSTAEMVRELAGQGHCGPR
jgi:hypothetical protein